MPDVQDVMRGYCLNIRSNFEQLGRSTAYITFLATIMTTLEILILFVVFDVLSSRAYES
jgi:hypothetical protein